jgi:hypothetical protein
MSTNIDIHIFSNIQMSDTTSIDDLPLSSQAPSSGHTPYGGGNGGGGGAPLIYSPNIGNEAMTSHGPTNVPGNVMNEVIQGVRRASANGMTMIPTRDIPMNPTVFTHDEQARPNYVPQPKSVHFADGDTGASGADYIKDHESMENIVRANARQSNQLDTLEAIYYDLQMPILVGVLYFIFQMPVFRAQLLHFLPSLFGEDGNFKIIGLTATSAMFAGTFFVITLIFKKLGEGIR